MGAIDDAAYAHSRYRPTATDEKTRKVFSVLVVFSGWHNFGKIIKIVAKRCHILKLRCTKFDFEWGCSSDPAGEAYSAPSDPLAGFKGAYFYKGKKRRERKMRKEGGEVKGWGIDIAWLDL